MIIKVSTTNEVSELNSGVLQPVLRAGRDPKDLLITLPLSGKARPEDLGTLAPKLHKHFISREDSPQNDIFRLRALTLLHFEYLIKSTGSTSNIDLIPFIWEWIYQ